MFWGKTGIENRSLADADPIIPSDCTHLESFPGKPERSETCELVRHNPTGKLYVKKLWDLSIYTGTEHYGMYDCKSHQLLYFQPTSKCYIPVESFSFEKKLKEGSRETFYEFSIYTPFVEGANLKSIFIDPGNGMHQLALPVLSVITRKTLIALREIHATNKCHTNLMPTNIFVKPNGDIALVDFMLDHPPKPGGSGMTRTVRNKWVTPEGLDEEHFAPRNTEGDIYQLGLTLLACFLRDHFSYPIHFMQMWQRGIIPPELHDFFVDHDELHDFISHMINCDPKERLTAEQLLEHPFITLYLDAEFTRDQLYLHPKVPCAIGFRRLPSLKILCAYKVHKYNLERSSLPPDCVEFVDPRGEVNRTKGEDDERDVEGPKIR